MVYVKRQWLNDENSASSGSVVAYSGPAWRTGIDADETWHYFEVADCHSKIRLHKSDIESLNHFINKLKKLAKAAEEFAAFLESVDGK